MAEIKLAGVSKSFGDTLVIGNLDLTITEGEFFTFVGPSGCVKSTILSMIAGLEDVSDGAIYFDGVCVNDLPPAGRDLAMVFQSYALYPHMNVRENMAFPLRIRKESEEKIEKEIKQVATLLGLKDLLDRKPGKLSGGQRQRVALGRAIIRRPRAFLMDEPLSNLDARLRIEMRAELKKLHQKYRTTTVYVTHDQEEAMVLSDRIVILRHGKVQPLGRPREVYANPVNLFVALFIGTPPMNLIDGSRLDKPSLFDPVLERLERKDIVIGIRPSDIAIHARERSGALECDVNLLEPTGNDLWVDASWRGNPIKGRAMPGEEIAIGKKAFFLIQLEKIHLFDKETGDRIEELSE